ncbi:hypothetical protein [Bacillus sp. FJAT-42376]|uniref:hypothetical protein n=1 Tax=Bacillus sp. FJAT-42376 TaxID=2014076 RepID=UPI0013DD96EB|nr:hypothetical protein [Bacillus sp. FJAT-42376]
MECCGSRIPPQKSTESVSRFLQQEPRLSEKYVKRMGISGIAANKSFFRSFYLFIQDGI